MYCTLTYGIVHSYVSLQRDPDRHENRCAHRHELRREEDVREEQGVEIGEELEVPPEALQDGPDKVVGVEADQGHQKEVEGVAHLVPGIIQRRGTLMYYKRTHILERVSGDDRRNLPESHSHSRDCNWHGVGFAPPPEAKGEILRIITEAQIPVGMRTHSGPNFPFPRHKLTFRERDRKG